MATGTSLVRHVDGRRRRRHRRRRRAGCFAPRTRPASRRSSQMRAAEAGYRAGQPRGHGRQRIGRLRHPRPGRCRASRAADACGSAVRIAAAGASDEEHPRRSSSWGVGPLPGLSTPIKRAVPVEVGRRRLDRVASGRACRIRPLRLDPRRPTRTIEAIQATFRSRDYIADRSLATAVFLALELGRPLLLEGEAGVGKTELAKVLAATPRRAADPAPVLRGPRRQHRGLRVELPAPDARDPAARGARRGRPTPAPTTSSARSS